MGKQSARMIYRGKDHKDIYFQGHYHDVMYLGYELLWRKIKQEGYYSIILCESASNSDETLIAIFDEKKNKFEIIRHIVAQRESPAQNVAPMVNSDNKRIYLTTLGKEKLIAESEDGINWENTNLVSGTYDSYLFFEYRNRYFDYVWGITSTIYKQSYDIFKRSIIYKDNKYSIEFKTVNTGLISDIRNDIRMYTAKNKLSRIAIHINKKSNSEDKNVTIATEQWKITIKYYDVESESSGLICNLTTSRDIDFSGLYALNDHYIFFTIEGYYISGDNYLNSKFDYYYYMYHSENGTDFEKTLIDKRNDLNGNVYKRTGCYRNGMYYFYGGNGVINEVLLTSDFEHFTIKKLKNEINIEGKSLGVQYFAEITESAETGLAFMGNVQYFCDGKRANPEDGMMCTYGTTIGENKIFYIDNMFFRESEGNKVLSWNFTK